MSNKYQITDEELQQLIASFEDSYKQITSLSKSSSSSLRKEDLPEKDKQKEEDEQEEKYPQEKDVQDEQKEQLGQDNLNEDTESVQEVSDEVPQEYLDQGDQGQDLPQEEYLDQEDEKPLTDEELEEIYESMPIEELERHYRFIQKAMQAIRQKDSEEQIPEVETEEILPDTSEQSDESKQEKGRIPMEKKEKNLQLAQLEKKIEDQGKALMVLTKAVEALISRPQRKAVTDIAFLEKGELKDQDLTDEEIKIKASTIAPHELTKSEREMINSFFLAGQNREEVKQIIKKVRGGK